MPAYESEITQFLKELLRQRPEIEVDQRRGRAIWWDKELDLQETQRLRESEVPQQAYPYQTGD
jgi:hypothetical protein